MNIPKRLMEIISLGLEGQEYVTILSWILVTYPGEELMRSWNLNIDSKTIKPLLSDEDIKNLQQDYLGKMGENYSAWMKNALSLEAEDWKSVNDPELDENNAYHTSAPKHIFQMIDENLQVAATISPEMTNKVYAMSLGQAVNFSRDYRDAIIEYKSKYFRDRAKVMLFTR